MRNKFDDYAKMDPFRNLETVLKLKVICFGRGEHANWHLINF